MPVHEDVAGSTVAVARLSGCRRACGRDLDQVDAGDATGSPPLRLLV